MASLRQEICSLLESVDVPVTPGFIKDHTSYDIGPILNELTRLEYSRHVECVGEVKITRKPARLFVLRFSKELSIVEREAVSYWIKKYVEEECRYIYDGHAELLVEILRIACEDSILMPDGVGWFDGPECKLFLSSMIDHWDYAIATWKRILIKLSQQEY